MILSFQAAFVTLLDAGYVQNKIKSMNCSGAGTRKSKPKPEISLQCPVVSVYYRGVTELNGGDSWSSPVGLSLLSQIILSIGQFNFGNIHLLAGEFPQQLFDSQLPQFMYPLLNCNKIVFYEWAQTECRCGELCGVEVSDMAGPTIGIDCQIPKLAI